MKIRPKRVLILSRPPEVEGKPGAEEGKAAIHAIVDFHDNTRHYGVFHASYNASFALGAQTADELRVCWIGTGEFITRRRLRTRINLKGAGRNKIPEILKFASRRNAFPIRAICIIRGLPHS